VAVLECVVNISEGRSAEVLSALATAAGDVLLDVHRDPDHNRAVFTMGGDSEDLRTPVRNLTTAAVERLDISQHQGVHPRLGAVDVVPFVPLEGSTMSDAVAERDSYARWAGDELGVPCFLYGPERSLPQLRREAFGSLRPDTGPASPHPSAGAIAVGARPPMVAYNVWLAEGDLDRAKTIARSLRSPAVRALAFPVAGTVQVSFNLVDPGAFGPAEAYDAVGHHARVQRAELVGLMPETVLRAIPPRRWAELDLAPEKTIEARLNRAG
jgi:glutamate formiminotransferase